MATKVFLKGLNVVIDAPNVVPRWIPQRAARVQPHGDRLQFHDSETGQSFFVDFDDLRDADNNGFATIEDAENYVSDFIGGFKSGETNGGNSSATNFSLTAQNYNDLSLVSGDNIGDLAFVFNSQGTKWLPGPLLGTFYPKGVYVWDGSLWVSNRNDISLELQRLQTGWAFYIDDQYTEASPFVVSQGQTVKLPNNAATIINTQLPLGYSDFYDGNKINTKNVFDSIAVSVRFKAKGSINQSGMAYYLDIGGTQGRIISDSRRFLRTAGVENPFNLESTPFCGSTFLANGCDVLVEAISGNLSIYDIQYKITLDHQGR